eukprot:maker-scaffold329_size204955-snap-gene-1.19 protein:Tk00270 transcript:maker-scaffold329_size204955-snap-gene-1.19-mRNA-1 annotation:"serine-arginine protein 55"
MGREQRVFVGNVPSHTRERDVERFFKNFGRIREVVLKHGYGFVEFDDYRRTEIEGGPRRVFINRSICSDAEDAVHEMDGKELLGERLRVELARSRPGRGGSDRGGDRGPRGGSGSYGRDRGSSRRYGGGRDDRDNRRGVPPGPRTGYRLIVENVASRTSWQDLKDFFRSAGDITYANVHSPRQGQGIVEFASRRGLDNALDNQEDIELDGRRLKIREERRGGRSNSGSRSRSRSRTPRSDGSRSRSRSKSRSRSRSPSRSRSRSKESN